MGDDKIAIKIDLFKNFTGAYLQRENFIFEGDFFCFIGIGSISRKDLSKAIRLNTGLIANIESSFDITTNYIVGPFETSFNVKTSQIYIRTYNGKPKFTSTNIILRNALHKFSLKI